MSASKIPNSVGKDLFSNGLANLNETLIRDRKYCDQTYIELVVFLLKVVEEAASINSDGFVTILALEFLLDLLHFRTGAKLRQCVGRVLPLDLSTLRIISS